MTLKRHQLNHRKKRDLVIGGVVIPAYNFWYGTGMIGGMTMATDGNSQHESQETPQQEAGEETSAPSTGAAAAGGDASSGATQSAM